MVKWYRVLAGLVAADVVVQAAMIAWGFSGLFHWVDDGGGVVRKSNLEGGMDFPEVAGFEVHWLNGTVVIPLLALALFGLAFRTGRDGAVKWAGTVLGLVALQVTLGYGALGLPLTGLLHGANALVLFWAAITAVRRIRQSPSAAAEPTPVGQRVPGDGSVS